MRAVLYIAAVAVYFGAQMAAANQQPELAQRLMNLWILGFLGISVDAVVQLKQSRLVFFPVLFALTALYLYLQLPGDEWAGAVQWLAHLPLGILLWQEGKSLKDSGNDAGNLLKVLSVLVLIFSLRFLIVFEPLSFLNYFYRLHLTSYLILALCGRVLLLGDYNYRLPVLQPLFAFLLVIHGVVVIEQLTGNWLV